MASDKKCAERRLIAPHEQSATFRQTREAHRLELAEDYVELIGDLIAAQGSAKQLDIAGRLGVAQPTVAKMLKRLAEDGLVEQHYGGVILTGKGEALAAETRDRHHVVVEFLLALGVSEETARQDAEGIEHHVSAETLAAMRDFARRQGKGKSG